MTTGLEQQLHHILEKRQRSSKLRILKRSPPDAIDLSSNDFLSLSTNAAFRQDFLNRLNSSELGLGSTGSRLLDGNSDFAERLELDIAAFHGAETALLTNSGFDANVSIFTCLPQPGDVVIYDELIHASVHDGMRASRAQQCLPFRHNDVPHLRQVLEHVLSTSSSNNIFVAVESVYSMEGDLAPLTQICDLIDALVPKDRAHLIVDEAHSNGCYGPNGSGRVSELGLQSRVSIRLHTFGKALACNGAAILCSPIIRLYLINYARPLIFTTFMSYPALVAIRTAYDWLIHGQAEDLARNLRNLSTYLFNRLQTQLPSKISELNDQSVIVLPETCPDSPIFALLSTVPRDLAAYCQAAGFVVRPVVPPTVPENTERVRVCLHAGNTTEQIDAFVECLQKWIEIKVEAQRETKPIEVEGVVEQQQQKQAKGRLVAKL